jgi:hypothetical protein
MKILLQTTIPDCANDWTIVRFGLLAELLGAQRNRLGRPIFEVTARDREPFGAPDSILATLDRSDYDQLWLFGVDCGEGLSKEDCEGISRFRHSGRGLMVTRDHMDVGSSICSLGSVGAAHHFHTRNLDPHSALERDDPYSTHISWPNFHSGANGDYQAIIVRGPTHPVLVSPSSPTGAIRFLPAHPHEGAVSAPQDHQARVIASGTSKTTGTKFNLAVAFEEQGGDGRAIAQSTFHHFADYNWDPRLGSPSFVDEPAGASILSHAEALQDTHRYSVNVALWLGRLDPSDHSLRSIR